MRDQETSLAAEAATYRLPTNVTPKRYQIRLTPDLKSFKFEGQETIEVQVNHATNVIELNALELEIDRIVAECDGKVIAGAPELSADNERARLKFSQPLDPGRWSLKLAFRGILNDKLHGFYRSQYKDSAGNTHTVATTQFESTDARRAFPCWDEPELKAIYKITLVVDENLAAISNAGIESERKIAGGKKEVVFKDTIKMSTYLVAFIVGEFEATAPTDLGGGVPLRVAHVPGKRELTGWAREIGAFSIRFFSDYYGIGYAGDKLDLIAIPDFAAGAMENFGAITFRETALLADEKTASRAELERVADVVSHENAHMWFGDLVTMKWWNGIWLNEAFATFMEMLAVDAWKPQWRRWDSFSISRAAAMNIDGLVNTRPIEFTVHSPEEARAMFDVLTYEKGASVLRMLEQYLGAAKFRDGIRHYLRKHQYANTETGDLWDALEHASGEPIRKTADSWIFQPGFPIVTASLSADGRSLKLGQTRFLYRADEKLDAQLWHVPLMVKAKTESGISSHKLLLSDKEATLELPAKAQWVLINETTSGFYRVRYSAPLLAALTRNLGELRPTERFQLVSDTWAATIAGLTPLAETLAMFRLFREETDLSVWRAILAAFNYLDMIIDEPDRRALAARVRETISPAVARLGWTARADDDELTRQLRGVLIGALGTLGDDGDVQGHARDLYARWDDAPDKADRDLMPHLVAILAHSGERSRYAEFKGKFKSPRNPQEEQRYLYSLAGFRQPELLRETIEMTLSSEVRTQNAPFLMQSLLFNPACRDEAWSFTKRNWEEMNRRYPDASLPRMCEGVVGLLDREREVTEFLSSHKLRLGGKLIDQHLERLGINVAFKNREGTKLAQTLKG